MDSVRLEAGMVRGCEAAISEDAAEAIVLGGDRLPCRQSHCARAFQFRSSSLYQLLSDWRQHAARAHIKTVAQTPRGTSSFSNSGGPEDPVSRYRNVVFGGSKMCETVPQQ